MEFKTIVYEKDDGIGTITLNRPKSMNAISNKVVSELDQVISKIAKDEEISVVIITGSEKVFAAGADIKEISGIKTPIEAHRFEVSIHALFNKIESIEKPVIAAVNGLALGGGCELTLVCDIRIAAENAVFGQPEIKIGVIPGAGGTQRLPRLIGVGRAKVLLYTGDSIDAREAYRIGLANKVVPVESLMDEAKKMAFKLKSQPPYALKITKMAVNEGINMDLQSALNYEARCFEIIFSTEDRKEGLRAFLEKTKPIFKGK
ncbi:MAG: enoyl-CoA hydratase/isomerase family protein [Deltaproteobacteria bacterium]|nr:enoyl-CoA hydratase/isomerase family protein [Deltaproteobacteria bacterium]